MRTFLFVLIGVFIVRPIQGQGFETFFSGNAKDTLTDAKGGICLMGGATEDDEAMRWFLEKANGGDILVLRASGSDGYNNYFFSELGVSVNSVETIVFNDVSAAKNSYIHQKIGQAEAIWFAGGDQWKYISYWRKSPIDSLINQAIAERNIVIGGTSAGMAIMGQFYFSAEHGTIRSAAALADPYDRNITLDSVSFLENRHLKNTITDTHFDNPDRKGRLVVFLARILEDFQTPVRAIACEENTAVCIEPDGTAKVFGGFPEHQDFAYFIQHNCVQSVNKPETIQAGESLTWEQGGAALKVFKVPGSSAGANTFNLNEWNSGTGGSWWNWQVDSGVLHESPGGVITCDPLSSDGFGMDTELKIAPNPTFDKLLISSKLIDLTLVDLKIIDLTGQKQLIRAHERSRTELLLDLSHYEKGLYHLQISQGEQISSHKFIKY